MLEDPSKFHMTLEGRVTITSGKMLIVDPFLVRGFERDWLYNFEPEHFHNMEEPVLCEYENLLGKQRLYTRAFFKHTDKLIEALEQKKPLPKSLPSFKKKEKRIEELREILQKRAKEHPYSPPHFLQGNGRVYGQTGFGDGMFPINRSDKGYTINFDGLPERNDCGLLAVDAGTFMISDAKDLEINDENSTFREYEEAKKQGVYCTLNVSNGNYTCRYVHSDKKVKINPVREK